MGSLPNSFWLEMVLILAIPATALAIVINRTITKKAFSARQIQFLGLVIIAALVVVLGLEGILEKSAVGALVGGLAGYLFGSFSKFDERSDA